MSKNEKLCAISLFLPFFLFLLMGTLEGANWNGLLTYPAAYAMKILLVGITCVFCVKYWAKQFPFRVTRATGLALVLGIVCTALWVGLAAVPVPNPLVSSEGARAAFNPFAAESGLSPNLAWGFWVVRMLGLAVVVPVIEEVFLRGFLLRWVQGGEWFFREIGIMTPLAWGTLAFYAVATHPELLAALVWFGLVTLYVRKTKNLWDAVAFHVGTNAGLGVWVLISGQWSLL